MADQVAFGLGQREAAGHRHHGGGQHAAGGQSGASSRFWMGSGTLVFAVMVVGSTRRVDEMEISRPSLRDSNNKLSCVGMGKLD